MCTRTKRRMCLESISQQTEKMLQSMAICGFFYLFGLKDNLRKIICMKVGEAGISICSFIRHEVHYSAGTLLVAEDTAWTKQMNFVLFCRRTDLKCVRIWWALWRNMNQNNEKDQDFWGEKERDWQRWLLWKGDIGAEEKKQPLSGERASKQRD